MKSEQRIVVIDGHIIAQFHSGRSGWWTCSKANNYNEGDFAVWPESTTGIRAARRLVGEVRVVVTNEKPIQRGNAWYTSADDRRAKSYSEALRAVARDVQARHV